MDAHNTVIPSRYFEQRQIDLADDDIVLVACMRNELLRLPYFLDHYRRLGVNRLLLVDNGSTDGTREYLEAQDDVEYFFTTLSYRGSEAGRQWSHELASTYATGHWVVMADVDEMLVFPGSERLDLPALCGYLDDEGYEGLFAPMIDMYSDRPLSQTLYESGGDLLATCPFFEIDTYALEALPNPPFLGVRGGPRDTWFAGSGRGGPLATKVPLVKWREGFSYIEAVHTHRAIQLADVTGALLHFKFLSTWNDVVRTDAARGDRRAARAWQVYADQSSSDPCFVGPQTLRYAGPSELVRLGVMVSSEPLRRYLGETLARDGEDAAATDDLLPAAETAPGGLTLRSMAAVWPLLQNPAIMRHFGLDEPRPDDYRVRLLQELRRSVDVVDIRADEVLVRIQNPALHRWRRSGLALAIYVGDRLVDRVMADGSAPGLEVATDSLEISISRWKVDLAAAAALESPEGGPVSVSVFLVDAASSSEPWPRPTDAQVFSGRWHQRQVTASREIGMLGEIHTFEDGEIRGWVYDVEEQSFSVPVSVYVNGRIVLYVRPNKVRRPLAEKVGAPAGAIGLGFRVPVPLGYFLDAGEQQAQIEVRVAGTNVALQHTPLQLPSRTRTARWSGQQWTPVSDAAVPGV